MAGNPHAPPYGPTTSVVEAFLEQLRHVPEQWPHVDLHPERRPRRVSHAASTALMAPTHRLTAVRQAQEAVAEILHTLTWPPDAHEIQAYVERCAPQVAAVLVLRGYVAPDELTAEYEQVYVDGWQAIFGAL